MRRVLPIEQLPADIPLLEGIEGRVRERVLSCLHASYVAYDIGELIREANVKQTSAAYLVSGKALGHMVDEDGNTSIVHLFEPNQVLSYGNVFGSQFHSSFDIVAREDCGVVVFDTDHLPIRCDHCRTYVAQVEHNLAQAVADLDAELMETLNIRLRRTIRGKILAYLEYEARRHNATSFDISFNRQELADYLCVDRAALSRELGVLRDEGQFTFNRNHFELNLKPRATRAVSA